MPNGLVTVVISKYATQQPFINLGKALKVYFKHKKDQTTFTKTGFPKFKKKSYSRGSFYIGGDQVVLGNPKVVSKNKESNKENISSYLKITLFGWVKLRENPRFQGKINNVRIS